MKDIRFRKRIFEKEYRYSFICFFLSASSLLHFIYCGIMQSQLIALVVM